MVYSKRLKVDQNRKFEFSMNSWEIDHFKSKFPCVNRRFAFRFYSSNAEFSCIKLFITDSNLLVEDSGSTKVTMLWIRSISGHLLVIRIVNHISIIKQILLATLSTTIPAASPCFSAITFSLETRLKALFPEISLYRIRLYGIDQGSTDRQLVLIRSEISKIF